MQVFTVEELAQVVTDAAEIHEKSYDKEKSDEAFKAGGIIDFVQFYQLSIKQSVDNACKKNKVDQRMSGILYLALEYFWNDALAWAESISSDD